MRMFLISVFIFLAACQKVVPGIHQAPDQCVDLNDCTTVSQGFIDTLVHSGLPEALKGYLPIGPSGAVGAKGDRGERGEQGPPGIEGLSGFNGIDGLPGPQGDVGPMGPQGPKGDQGDRGPQGQVGPQGANGVGFSNTSVLSAVRVFSPSVMDYVGSTTVNTSATFVPSVINVVVGFQKVGAAFVFFGDIKCSYVGNNKSGSALALYSFVDCRDAGGAIISDMKPGYPFAFTGTIKLQVGDGADPDSPLQVVAFFQIQ